MGEPAPQNHLVCKGQHLRSLPKCKNEITHQTSTVGSWAVWIFYFLFLYPSFLFYQKHMEKTNESKPTGNNSTLSPNTKGLLLLSPDHSNEAKSTIQAQPVLCRKSKHVKHLEQYSKYLIHVSCYYELLLHSSNYINITFSWHLEN